MSDGYSYKCIGCMADVSVICSLCPACRLEELFREQRRKALGGGPQWPWKYW